MWFAALVACACLFGACGGSQPDYAPAPALAGGLQRVRDGVRYRILHDLSGRLIAIGWFGDAGAVTRSALAALPRPTTRWASSTAPTVTGAAEPRCCGAA